MAIENIKYESEALMIIESVTEHTTKIEPSEKSLENLIEKVSDLIEDILIRETNE